MAFNNVYPMNYPYQVPQQQTNNGSFIWVQGEAGAKSYLVAPNNTVQLWDSEQNTIYLKSADSTGMPSMKILDYTIRDTTNVPVKAPLSMPVKEYVTKDELEAFKAEIMKLTEVKTDVE